MLLLGRPRRRVGAPRGLHCGPREPPRRVADRVRHRGACVGAVRPATPCTGRGSTNNRTLIFAKIAPLGFPLKCRFASPAHNAQRAARCIARRDSPPPSG